MLSLIFIIISALFFPGIILRTKSFFSGRKGPGIFQPLKDIIVLLKKGSVFSTSTGIIFQIAPVVSIVSILCATLLIPFQGKPPLVSFSGDFVYFAYLLALGKFFSIVGALDTGSSFEGMGANREALYSLLVEPVFFILLGSLAMFSGYDSFSDIFAVIQFTNPNSYLLGLLSFFLLIQVAMVENSRIPVDDPKTHLELTMVHEVMVLDNCGFDMALIHIGTALKFAIYGALVFNTIIPPTWTFYLQIPCFLGIQLLSAFIVGLIESFRARKQLIKNPKFILTLTSIALITFLIVLILNNKLLD